MSLSSPELVQQRLEKVDYTSSGLYLVERDAFDWCRWSTFASSKALVVRDCNARDGEWPAFITLPHEHAEWNGRDVPLFEGDVERREWHERRRLCRR